ncbi:MAG: hypothetical protein A3J79_10675 [Elusimicrobia bacterium RIFOXYB2_FULL_62_6]|nr:MAG: hypothetical protein A3J79_10675 [Elusimicrobia bacterium RIFOXYB2_FULL_62_6]
MAPLRKKMKSYPLIPEEERKCVWMATGFISYKLCDRSYQCETCPFDQAIRNEELGDEDFQESEENGPKGSLNLRLKKEPELIILRPERRWLADHNKTGKS